MSTVDINIDVKLDSDIDAVMLPLFNKAVESAIMTSLSLIKDRWQQQAQNKLNSTRTDYLLGLDFDSVVYPYNNNPFSGAVILRGKLANSLELGYSAFDMKKGFAGSSKVVATQNGGWYLTIPIRHSTPNSFMYGKPMPKDIYAEAKKLPHWGSLKVSGGQLTSWTGYQHKANIHDSLTRIIKPNGKTKQSQYYTFRRVSNNSDPLSWWHPGYAGVHIAETLEGYASQVFDSCIKANIKQIFG